eukprot:3932288-Rhodomonas_salina.3
MLTSSLHSRLPRHTQKLPLFDFESSHSTALDNPQRAGASATCRHTRSAVQGSDMACGGSYRRQL